MPPCSPPRNPGTYLSCTGSHLCNRVREVIVHDDRCAGAATTAAASAASRATQARNAEAASGRVPAAHQQLLDAAAAGPASRVSLRVSFMPLPGTTVISCRFAERGRPRARGSSSSTSVAIGPGRQRAPPPPPRAHASSSTAHGESCLNIDDVSHACPKGTCSFRASKQIIDGAGWLVLRLGKGCAAPEQQCGGQFHHHQLY